VTFEPNFGAEPMRIAIVGGIYGKDESYRRKVHFTPETILERGFAARGCEITTFSHYAAIDIKQFDVVHVHHLSYGTARVAVDNSHAAFVYTSHDPLAMSGLLHPHRQLATQFVISRADAVVALSKREAEFQQRNYHLAGAVHTVIPNGIDPANYLYARNNAAGKGRPWQLLYVGQLNALKNVDVLVRALPQVKQPVELELVYHNSTLEIPLRKLAVELGLNERIRFLGPKNPRELAALYQRADAFVLPSAGEALPSVITEAMLCGTPVIATDVGGVREQLSGYGVCVPPGRPNELAAAISHVLDHYEHFDAQSRSASAYAQKQFSIESMIDRHEELFVSLLEKRGPRRRHTAFRVPVNAVVKMGVSLICATKRRPSGDALSLKP
jgi:glycosyltransferase involved in cell wall biosynthesis